MGCGEMKKDDERGKECQDERDGEGREDDDMGRDVNNDQGRKCNEGGSMSSKEEGMSEAKERGMIKRKRTYERMRSEIGAIGEGQVPGGWAPSLKNINEKKSKDSRTVNGSGYYNGTAMSVKEMIRAFEQKRDWHHQHLRHLLGRHHHPG